MFTGLIETTGTVLRTERGAGSMRIAIAAPALRLRTGDSIAVSGVCLTALDIESRPDSTVFHADLASETVERTSLARLTPGATVNLELPTPAGAPLGGHLVQGHVDGTGVLLSLTPVDAAADPAHIDRWLRVAVPAAIGRYIVEKGSIAVEGISLTVARWRPGTEEGDVVEVAIIPHTYLRTNLHTLKDGQPLNLEADVSMKFLEQRQRETDFELTVGYLLAHGY